VILRIATLAVTAISVPVVAEPCRDWNQPQVVGHLDTGSIMEASGIATSRRFAGRLYHNNDSGDGPFFYLTNRSGEGTTRVSVAGFEPLDVEDIALGRCGSASDCLYLGDIGDNAHARETVRFVEIEELETFPAAVEPVAVVTARYPDGPHDAESFAIHPNGDLFLVTKSGSMAAHTAERAQIFKLTADQLRSRPDTVQTFELVGTIDLPRYLPGDGLAQLATSMDISPDGKRTLILTYGSAFEWQQDLADAFDPVRPLVPGRDYTIMPLPLLPQAEGIAYLPGEDGFIYSTELARAADAPLYEQTCARR
jgi:hypothetical protein